MKKGMNPEAVDQMSTQIEDAGQNVQQSYSKIQGRVTELDWTGEDRDRYVSEFEGTLGQQVQQVVQRATEFAERARQNSAGQRDTSTS